MTSAIKVPAAGVLGGEANVRPLPLESQICYLPPRNGDVAQLGERGVRNAEVGSSILLVSTRCKIPTLISRDLLARSPPCNDRVWRIRS